MCNGFVAPLARPYESKPDTPLAQYGGPWMLFADAADTGINAAITAILLAIAAWIQSTLKQRKDDKAAAILAKKTDLASKKVDDVYTAVNGGGIQGKLDKVIRNQTEHDRKDVEHFQKLDGRMDSMEKLIKGENPAE